MNDVQANASGEPVRRVRRGSFPRFRDLSIRWQGTVVSLAASCTAVVVACGVFLVFDQIAFRRQTLEQFHGLAQVIGANSTAAIAFHDADVATRILAALDGQQDVLWASLADTTGALLATYERMPVARELLVAQSRAEGPALRPGRVDVTAPVWLDNEKIGSVYIAFSRRPMRERLHHFAAVMLAVLLVSAAAALALAAILQARVSGPVLELAATTQRITQEEDFSLRARHAGADEIGALVRAFNTMLDHIEASGSELRRHQDRLRSLAHQVLLTGERERRRVADGLHDSICQLLWFAVATAKRLGKETDAEKVRAGLREIVDVVEHAQEEARSLTFQLIPPCLYDLGLGAAIVALAKELHSIHGLTVEVEGEEPEVDCDEVVRVLLYRSVRELLMNVAKYARTSAASVSLQSHDGRVRVRVADDGAGFDPRAAPAEESTHGFGLFSIREHMANVGGRFEIRSAPGQGTVAVLEAPQHVAPTSTPLA